MKLHHLRAAFLVICFLVCSQGEGSPDPSRQECLLQDNLQALDFNTLVAPGQTLAEEPLSPSTCSWGQFASDTGYHIARDPKPSRKINVNGPWVYLAGDNGNSFRIWLESFDFPIRAWGGAITCAGIGGVRPAEISIDGWIGFSTMTVNGTWEPTYGNAGSEASITSFDVDRQGLYLDYDVPAGFDFLSDATFGNAGPGSWQIHPEASITSLHIETSGTYVDLDAGIFDFLGDATADLVIPAVKNLAKDAFVDAIRSQLQVLIPEPTTLSLLAMSLLLAARRWR